MRRWLYSDVTWGVTLCEVDRCIRVADLLVDDEPRCLDCAERELDWILAREQHPDHAHTGVAWTAWVPGDDAGPDWLAA